MQHCAGTLKPIISADNKAHIVVFLGRTFPVKTQKPAGSADSNLAVDGKVKDVDTAEAQGKIHLCEI